MTLKHLQESFLWKMCSGAHTGEKGEPATMHIFLGFFFLLNFCIGPGFLGIPYSFFYSGYLAAVPTLVLIALVNCVTVLYLLEIMARAQALEYLKESQESGSDNYSKSEQDQSLLTSSEEFVHPRFEITLQRKFEITELCEVFFNKYFKYFYSIVFCAFCFLQSWSFTTVVGTAWAINFPFIYHGNACQEDSFLHQVVPEGDCLYVYYISLTIFAAIIVLLSVLNLREQAAVQITLGLLRFITIAIMVFYSLVHLGIGGDGCQDYPQAVNLTTPIKIDISSIVLKFDPKGWVVAIPVLAFAFIFHTGVSSLTHPVKQKPYLHWMVIAVFLTSGICYASLGLIVPLWFRQSIQEVATLNWAVFTHTNYRLPLRIFSYYITIFPSLDIISAYPLLNHIWVNNIYLLIIGRDTSLKPTIRFDWIFRIFLRILLAILPIIAAFNVANLIYVLKYAGLVAFLNFAFPVVLQIRSIHVCKKKFSEFHESLSDSHSKEMETENSKNTSQDPQLVKGSKSNAIGKSKDKKLARKQRERALYMTPYSIGIISHPVFGWVMGGIGICLFVLTVVNLFVHPVMLRCDDQLLEDEVRYSLFS